MTAEPLRVLFCIGINQNFFDLPADNITTGDVWKAFVTLLDELKAFPGVQYIGDIDDDAHMVGPSYGWPWSCYILADVDTRDTVVAACNLLRTTPVAGGDVRLWRFAKIEARIGRALTVRDDVSLPD
ncbi:hypothetical protein C5E45_23205 [Nocardia nova]|uniref:IacB protein n=1 Tax=Nocardia nova TaxID=37330 RepID=A0A2S6AKI5_9NOCA|nr:hypothetical protein [Nocardia nova]PPJ22289.1 hypothetical protein C5E41_27405 [Nocardia nova]PPJ35751.1 hypothetical protein C5E45_23205 [Nocardia nova]